MARVYVTDRESQADLKVLKVDFYRSKLMKRFMMIIAVSVFVSGFLFAEKVLVSTNKTGTLYIYRGENIGSEFLYDIVGWKDKYKAVTVALLKYNSIMLMMASYESPL